MSYFTFQCPHCGKPNPIDHDKLNTPTACIDCGLPFAASLPVGRLMVQEGENWKPAATQGAAVKAEQDEVDVLRVNPAVFRDYPLQTLVLLVVLLGGLTMIVAFGNRADVHIGNALLAVVGVLATLVSAYILISRLVRSRFESLTITSQRTIWARGLIHRQTSEVQHDDIRNIQVNQSLVDRMVKAGTVSISSAGQDDMEIVARGIPHPQRIIDAIRLHQRRMVKAD